MKRKLSALRVTIAIFAAVVLAIPMNVVATQTQDFAPDRYVSSLTGFEVTVAGPNFSIVDAELEHYRTGEGEIVSIESEYAIVEVSFFDDKDTPNDSIDAYLGNLETSADEFTVVDRGSKRGVFHAYATFTYDGVDMAIYAQVTEDVVDNVDLFEMLISNVDDFSIDLGNAQDEIEIDGSSFLAGVEGEALASGDEAISTPDSGEGGSISADPREGARIGNGQAGADRNNVDPGDSTPDVTTTVLTDSSWQGPIFGQVIAWDPDTWFVDQTLDNAVYSNEDEMVDSITLNSDAWSTPPFVYIAVIDDAAHSPADYLEYWSSDDYAADVLLVNGEGEADVLTSRSRTNGVSVIIEYTLNGNTYIRVNQMVDLGDGTLLMTQIDGTPDEIVDIYDAALQDITFNGEALPTILATRQIERAIGN